MSRELVGHLANYAYSFKPYPNKAEWLEICQALIDIYPYLRNDIGIGIHGWEIKLLNKLKKIRQGDTSVEVQLNRLIPKIDGTKVPKNATINPKKGELNWAPDHVTGENERSVALHKTNLKNEAAKSENYQDKGKITALMSLTYSFRRQDINNKILVENLKEEYPLFFQRNEQLEEFKRLTAVDIKDVFYQESKNQGQMLYKLFRKKKSNEETLLLSNFVAECRDFEVIKRIEAEISFGFFILPYLLKEEVECLKL